MGRDEHNHRSVIGFLFILNDRDDVQSYYEMTLHISTRILWVEQDSQVPSTSAAF